MNADDQPDKSSGMEERWRTVFDKIFQELRTNHPADEWTIRLVDQLITIKGAEDVSGPPTPELVVDETTDKEENNLEVAATPERVDDEIQKEVNHVERESPSSLHHDSIGGEFIHLPSDGSQREELPKTVDPTQVVNPETTSLNVSQQEKAGQPLDMQPEQPVEPDGILVAAGHEDDQVDCAMTEILADQVQAVQLHLEAGGEVATKQGDQGEINECPDEAVEKQLQESESGSSIGLEAQDNSQQVWSEKENEPTLIHDDQKTQETIETEHVTINGQGQIEPVHIQEIPPEQLREINETLAVLDAVTIDTSTNQQQTTQVNNVILPETKDEIIQNNANASEEIRDQVVQEDTVALTPQSDPLIETHFDSANSESTQVIQVNGQQVVEAVEEMTKDASLVENLITDDDPPRQVEELQVTPVQVTTPTRPITPVQRLGASSPQLAASSNGDGQLKPVVSATKKSPENEVIRKPEWMRRPLVRKGSVGRFLGRMKETMQSKRFHPDRLPVVPPPQPEPPKRPPRRKTLANLDLSRESETTSKELTSPAPSTPKSAPVSEFENKSATLRSNMSDRKRKNSVGRFIGRVLSTKHLNATEVTAAEEAPLLNQEPQNTGQQQPPPPHSPTTPRSSTPAPSEKSKKGPAMAVNDMGIFLRRILRPKTAAAEESKDKPTPQRPPPPSRHQTPIPNEKSFDINKDEQNKPVIKTGKVHFECQTCHHEWKSARGIAKCEIMVNQVGEGIRQGEIFVRLYGQQCKRCTSHVFETAEWSAEGIAKVLTDLRAVVGRRFYPDEDVPKAHQKRLCQACQEGVCQSKTSR